METLLFALVVTLVLKLLLQFEPGIKEGLGIGALTGLSVWLRPDGLTLLGPAMFIVVFRKNGWGKKGLMASLVVAGFIALFVPYLVFNQSTAAAWWPNTFFAKQAEYAVLRQVPFLLRLWREILLPLEGSGVILLPAALLLLGEGVWRRRWNLVAIFAWLSGYLVLYACACQSITRMADTWFR